MFFFSFFLFFVWKSVILHFFGKKHKKAQKRGGGGSEKKHKNIQKKVQRCSNGRKGENPAYSLISVCRSFSLFPHFFSTFIWSSAVTEAEALGDTHKKNKNSSAAPGCCGGGIQGRGRHRATPESQPGPSASLGETLSYFWVS